MRTDQVPEERESALRSRRFAGVPGRSPGCCALAQRPGPASPASGMAREGGTARGRGALRCEPLAPPSRGQRTTYKTDTKHGRSTRWGHPTVQVSGHLLGTESKCDRAMQSRCGARDRNHRSERKPTRAATRHPEAVAGPPGKSMSTCVVLRKTFSSMRLTQRFAIRRASAPVARAAQARRGRDGKSARRAAARAQNRSHSQTATNLHPACRQRPS